MQVIFNTALPFFALIFCGYGAGRFGLLNPAAVTGVNTFVFYFALPTFIFNLTATSDLADIFKAQFMAAYLSAGLVVFVLAAGLGRLLFRVKLGESAVLGAAAVLGNTGYMGLPLVSAAFGREAAIPLLLGLTIEATIFIPLTIAVVEADRGEGQWLKVAGSVSAALARNPLIISIFAGILVSGFASSFAFELPAPIANFTDLLGNAAGPCALFALGATLVGRPLLSGLPETSYMSTFKLLIHPSAMWFATTLIFTVDPLWSTVAVLGASLPVAANVFVVARQYNTYLERASSAILLSTLVSMVTVSILLVLLSSA